MPPVFSRPIDEADEAEEVDEPTTEDNVRALAATPDFVQEVFLFMLNRDAYRARALEAMARAGRFPDEVAEARRRENRRQRRGGLVQHTNAIDDANAGPSKLSTSGLLMTPSGSAISSNARTANDTDDGGVRGNDANADDEQGGDSVRVSDVEQAVVVQGGSVHQSSEHGTIVGDGDTDLEENQDGTVFQERTELTHQWVGGRYRALGASEDFSDQRASGPQGDASDDEVPSLTGSQPTSGLFVDAPEYSALAGSQTGTQTSSDLFVDAPEEPTDSYESHIDLGVVHPSSPERRDLHEDEDIEIKRTGGARLSGSPYRTPSVESSPGGGARLSISPYSSTHAASNPAELDNSSTSSSATDADTNNRASPSPPTTQAFHVQIPTSHLSPAEFLDSLPLPTFKLSWDKTPCNTTEEKPIRSIPQQATIMASSNGKANGHELRPSYSKVASSSQPELPKEPKEPEERVTRSTPVVFKAKKRRGKGKGRGYGNSIPSVPQNSGENPGELTSASPGEATWSHAAKEPPAGLSSRLNKPSIDDSSMPNLIPSTPKLTEASTSKTATSSKMLGNLNTATANTVEKSNGKAPEMTSTYAAALMKVTNADETMGNSSSSSTDGSINNSTGDAKSALDTAAARTAALLEKIEAVVAKPSTASIAKSSATTAAAGNSSDKTSTNPIRPIPLKELVAPYDPKDPLANYPPEPIKVKKTKAKILGMVKKHPKVPGGAQIWNLHTKKYEATPQQTEDYIEWVKLCHKFPPILTSDGALGTWDACFSKQYVFDEPEKPSHALKLGKSRSYGNPLLDILAKAIRERNQARAQQTLDEAKAEGSKHVAAMTEKAEKAKAASDKGIGKEPVYLNAQQSGAGASGAEISEASSRSNAPSKSPILFGHNHKESCANWPNTYDSSVINQQHVPGDEWLRRIPPVPPVPAWRKDHEAIQAAVQAAEERGEAFDEEKFRREFEEAARVASEAKDEDDEHEMSTSAAENQDQLEMSLRGGGPVDYDPSPDSDDDFALSAQDFCDDDLEVSLLDDSDTQLPNSTDFEDHEIRTATELGSNYGVLSDYQLFYPNVPNFTQSKTWVSDEEQNRMRYAKTVTNFHHARMNDSPALPKSFKEYIELKAELAREKYRVAAQQLEQKLTKTEAIRHNITTGLPTDHLEEAKLSPALSAIQQNDKLSTVLSRASIWHECLTEQPLSDWPAYKYFKADGDDRAKGCYRRFLPLPRARRLDQKFAHLAEASDGVPRAGPGVPYEFREVLHFAANPDKDLLFPAELRVDHDQQAEQISLEDCPQSVRELLQVIDEL